MVVMAATVLVSAALLIAAWGGGKPVQGPQAFSAPALAAAPHRPQELIGNLGGMPVTIPPGMADLVQYDGDPGWAGARQGPAPRRTHDSRLTSFGFELRFPDMAALSTPAMREDKRRQSIYETRWLSIAVISGQAYPADRFLDRQAKFLDEPHGTFWFRNYDKLPEPVHQLTAYVLTGVDPNTGRPAKESPREHDVFVHRDASGAVTSFITCGNVPHAAARCKQDWSLEREGVHAVVSASYRRGLLPHWLDIQAGVSRVILGFKTPDGQGQSTPSPQH